MRFSEGSHVLFADSEGNQRHGIVKGRSTRLPRYYVAADGSAATWSVPADRVVASPTADSTRTESDEEFLDSVWSGLERADG